MTIVDSIIFGVVQGLTEFLPVSSSGHLVILHNFLGTNVGDISFDILLHVATLCAVLVYFRQDIFKILTNIYHLLIRKDVDPRETRLLYALAIGTIPAALLGALFSTQIENLFRSTFSVAIALIVGSILFIIAETFSKENNNISGKHGFLIGCFQACALVPGISRSGATISGGLILGLTRELAVRFSFLLSIPIIFGAGLVKILDGGMPAITLPIAVGTITAFITGLLAIHFLVRFLKNHTLMVFAWYRIIFAVVLLFIF